MMEKISLKVPQKWTKRKKSQSQERKRTRTRKRPSLLNSRPIQPGATNNAKGYRKKQA